MKTEGHYWDVVMTPVEYSIHPLKGAFACRWETKPESDWTLVCIQNTRRKALGLH